MISAYRILLLKARKEQEDIVCERPNTVHNNAIVPPTAPLASSWTPAKPHTAAARTCGRHERDGRGSAYGRDTYDSA